jgi:hypothetical protein
MHLIFFLISKKKKKNYINKYYFIYKYDFLCLNLLILSSLGNYKCLLRPAKLNNGLLSLFSNIFYELN